jgi:lipoprotein-anchoring transpeptidase ErfK/SrfK
MRGTRALVAVVASLALAAGVAPAAGAATSPSPPPAGTATSVPSTPSGAATPTRTTQALPSRPVPANSGTGRRIVYQESVPQHVWVIDGKGRVVRDFPVSGRKDWPRPGTYRVFSKSPRSSSQQYLVTFNWMIRFAHGRSASIGFHDIPRYYRGGLVHPVSGLGQALGKGGCPHLRADNAKWLYSWAGIGTKVVVVRS